MRAKSAPDILGALFNVDSISNDGDALESTFIEWLSSSLCDQSDFSELEKLFSLVSALDLLESGHLLLII
jgi:hypothetical protein